MVIMLAIKVVALKLQFLQNSDVFQLPKLPRLVRDIRCQLLERNVLWNVSNLKLPVQMEHANYDVILLIQPVMTVRQERFYYLIQLILSVNPNQRVLDTFLVIINVFPIAELSLKRTVILIRLA